MATVGETGLRFVPSAVEGLPSVTVVVIFPDRIEFFSDGHCVVIRYLDIARWHGWGGWFYRRLGRLGWRVRGWPSIGDRDWFHPPSGRFFRFFTEPPITVYMPDESRSIEYGQTMFRRLQNVLAAGGFCTYDLG
jgi:hypothetical protein